MYVRSSAIINFVVKGTGAQYKVLAIVVGIVSGSAVLLLILRWVRNSSVCLAQKNGYETI